MAGASSPTGAASGPAGAGGAGGPNARRFGGGNRVQPVTVAQARQQDVKVILSAIGNINAMNTAVVRAKVDGELKAIRFKEGQQVRAGALLAEIDARSFEIALAQAQSQLARDQALLKNAQVDLERYKDLLAKDSIAKQQVDTQEALTQQLAATLQNDQAQVDNAKLQLSYTKITAPISSRLGLKQADLGNVIRSSDTNGLVTITQTQPISAVFALPEANLQQLARKLRGTDALGVEAWDRDLRNVLASGKVTTIDNSIDPVTGTIKVKAEFANADGSLFPNQFVNIKLQINTLEAALAVPSTAVQRGAQGTFVYVVKPDSNVTVRRIRVGTTEGDWVSVQGELAAGDKVVTDGADRLREGAKVEVITPSRGFGGFGQGGPGGGLGGPRRDGANSGAGAAGAPGGAASGPRGASAPAASTEQKAAGPSDAVTGKPPQAAPTSQGGRPAPASGGAVSSPPSAAPASPGAAAGTASTSWIDNLPPEAQDRVRAMMSRLPPDEAARVNKMTPEERRAFFQQMRERRQQMQSQ
jgi:multidrug efflux system membrane fusion protein